MNASQFMDKQILGLAAAGAASPPPPPAGGGGGGVFFDLTSPNPQEEMDGHDRHGLRAGAAAVAPAATANPWGSLDSKAASSPFKGAGILEHHVLKSVSHEEERSNLDVATVAVIDRTMKKYADNLLHALEGVSSRLSQLEERTHYLESSVGELKLTIGNHNGSTDGKLRQFESTLREVQAGVQILRDKQDIVETQIQLGKLQVFKAEDVQSENAGAGHADSWQQPTLPQLTIQPQHQGPPPSQPLALPAPPALPAPNAPPPPPVQNQPPSQLTGHLPHSLVQSAPPALPAPSETYYPSSAQPTDVIHQQYQAPPAPQPQTAPAPPQHYQTPPQYAQYSQPPPANVNPSTAVPPPVPQQPEEGTPYGPPAHSYPPNVHPPSLYMPPPSGPAPPFYGPNPGMYESPAVRPNSGPPPSYNTGYKPQGGGGFSEPYVYSGSPSHRSNAGMKTSSPFNMSAATSGGSSNYGRLPTAQMLPQATPVNSGPSASAGSRVAIDDVVEKVATMGFSREQVRVAVQRLTEDGQNVDLNVVLDKLMNDTGAQPQRGWAGR